MADYSAKPKQSVNHMERGITGVVLVHAGMQALLVTNAKRMVSVYQRLTHCDHLR